MIMGDGFEVNATRSSLSPSLCLERSPLLSNNKVWERESTKFGTEMEKMLREHKHEQHERIIHDWEAIVYQSYRCGARETKRARANRLATIRLGWVGLAHRDRVTQG